MEYFIDFWLVAVIVASVTAVSPFLVSGVTWPKSIRRAAIALVSVGAFSHLTLLLTLI
ncbi:TMhelix containing protein [Vibrio phage 1.244.A._10N.261.54.C3]|nr:TMhelix containing protein [Vibrio phage 1.244.A._10N.261.54.C3]AUR98665.1 TMhelix containing protein [Vibrio phage 1.255.O._10N.286.45.F1]